MLLALVLGGAAACRGLAGADVERVSGEKELLVEEQVFVIGPQRSATLEATSLEVAPTALALLSGQVVAATVRGLVAPEPGNELSLVHLPLEDGVAAEAADVPVHALAQREGGGVLLAAGSVLLHDADWHLLRSPLTERVDAAAVRALDVSGSGTSEVVWFTLTDGALRVSTQHRHAVRLPGRGPPQLAVGLPEGGALLALAGDLYSVELEPPGAVLVARDIGAVHGSARLSGWLYLATERGLLARTPDGSHRLATFVRSDGTPLPVRAVTVGAGALHLLAGDSLLALRNGTYLHLTELPAGEGPRSLAVDVQGHAWVGGPGGLVRARTGDNVSFTDVRPFLETHCASCHATGAQGTPVLDLTSYAGAVASAPRILARLGDAQSPMPPRHVEVLAPEEWLVVSMWVGGGMKP